MWVDVKDREAEPRGETDWPRAEQAVCWFATMASTTPVSIPHGNGWAGCQSIERYGSIRSLTALISSALSLSLSKYIRGSPSPPLNASFFPHPSQLRTHLRTGSTYSHACGTEYFLVKYSKHIPSKPTLLAFSRLFTVCFFRCFTCVLLCTDYLYHPPNISTWWICISDATPQPTHSLRASLYLYMTLIPHLTQF